MEHIIRLNKAATALLTAGICWALIAIGSESTHTPSEALSHHLEEAAGILFFLLGAMTIVELIDAHDGFELITARIKTTNKRKLLWIVSLLSFFLSAVLDNLTTTIVIVSLLGKILAKRNDRLMFAGMVVIAANAGGAWSPIGDVTTTMLWIGGQISALTIMRFAILPSLVCLVIPLIFAGFRMRGTIERIDNKKNELNRHELARERNIVFWIGISCLLFVPIFKTVTHLPPYMGMLFGLGLMWLITEIIHSGRDEAEKGIYSVNHALRKIDSPSILFFLGILLSIGALQTTGMLTSAANYLSENIGDIRVINIIIGLLSAIVDNVPLVAAVQGMYGLDRYPTDHFFWQFLAYCSGTGGSALIIGSAAGIAAMGMEKMEFGWYLKNISWLALAGFISGAAVFILMGS
jgi:Na+/H+ antiporter NhaD/arsenite permease-like protein